MALAALLRSRELLDDRFEPTDDLPSRRKLKSGVQ
jgi:hypothetical protein